MLMQQTLTLNSESVDSGVRVKTISVSIDHDTIPSSFLVRTMTVQHGYEVISDHVVKEWHDLDVLDEDASSLCRTMMAIVRGERFPFA